MLIELAAICDSIPKKAVFEPWSHVETASCSQVVAEVCACVNWAVDRRRAVTDSQEQWYAVGDIRPSSEFSASRSGKKICNIVEEGQIEFVSVSAPNISAPGPSSFPTASGKSKKRKVSQSPLELPRRFEKASPPRSSEQHHIVI